jgi:intracellular septation protein
MSEPLTPTPQDPSAPSSASKAPPHPFAKTIWRDLLFAVIFLISGFIWGVFPATVIAAVGALILVIWNYIDLKRVDWTMLGVAVVSFGFIAAALYMDDPALVKYRPTFTSGVLAITIFALMAIRVSFTERTMGALYVLSAKHWRVLDTCTAAYALVRGALNYWVASSFPDSTWLWYSTFISKGMGFVYAGLVVFYINKVMLDFQDPEAMFPPAEKRSPWMQKLLDSLRSEQK